MNTTEAKTNDCLLDSFSETFNILDATIDKLKIYLEKDGLIIEVYMKLLYPRGVNFKLRFCRVKEYYFYWNEKYTFYNIRSYKFFKTNNLFYISFDPYDEEEIISQNDGDFILCEKIEGIFLALHDETSK